MALRINVNVLIILTSKGLPVAKKGGFRKKWQEKEEYYAFLAENESLGLRVSPEAGKQV